jgi:hypothetical protein
MWRPAHGATSRPGPYRPASGYGRAVGRPGPRVDGPLVEETGVGVLDPSAFGATIGSADADVEVTVEASAPVTP